MYLLQELRRRKVFRLTALYIVGAWVVLQVADLTFESWDIASSALRYVWLGAILGFPVALIFAWLYVNLEFQRCLGRYQPQAATRIVCVKTQLSFRSPGETRCRIGTIIESIKTRRSMVIMASSASSRLAGGTVRVNCSTPS